MSIEDEQKLVEQLRNKLGAPAEQSDARKELEKLFGEKEEAPEKKLYEKMKKTTIKVGDEFNIQIERIAFGGEGLGKHKNIPIFVPEGVPGDTVSVRITDAKKNMYRADIIDYIARSTNRVEPRCAHFNRCGGCRLQNLVYTAQLKTKLEMTKDLFRNIVGTNVPIRALIPSPEIFGYRLRAKLKTTVINSECRIGFTASKSHEIVPINECPVLAPILNRIIASLPEALPKPGTSDIPSEIHLQCDSECQNAAIHLISDEPLYYCDELLQKLTGIGLPILGISLKCKSGMEYFGSPEVTHQIGSNSFRVTGSSFFQANRFLLKTLQNQAIIQASPSSSDRFLDLYCGTGFFTIPFSRFTEISVGLDQDTHAIEYAQLNAKVNNLPDIRFAQSQDQHFFKDKNVKNTDFNLIVADPPRSGMKSEVLSEIIKQKPGKFLYISCNPPHLVRDLSILLESDFKLRMVQPIDLFPHTHHIEVMAFLTHKYTGYQAALASLPNFD